MNFDKDNRNIYETFEDAMKEMKDNCIVTFKTANNRRELDLSNWGYYIVEPIATANELDIAHFNSK